MEKERRCTFLKPMLLTATETIPSGADWLFETKYDGFRCILEWNKDIELYSRNEGNLSKQFPEILDFLASIKEKMKSYLPLALDGELVYLANDYKSEFSIVQSRARLRSKEKINDQRNHFPCQFVVFDILQIKGKDITNLSFLKRKEKLKELFEKVSLPVTVMQNNLASVQMVEPFDDPNQLWKQLVIYNGEGLVAKEISSQWIENTRTNSWLKIKNWRYVNVMVTAYEQENNFFIGSVLSEKEFVEVVTFKHGMKEEEIKILSQLFKQNGVKINQNRWELSPSIGVKIACIDFVGGKLREPRFEAFQFNIEPEDCTWHKLEKDLYPLPSSVEITHPDKPIFPLVRIKKDDYLYYLQVISPYLLAFLFNRPLTLIRYPHGVPGESFYQKSAPVHVPSFVTVKDDQLYCNNVETLLWLGNQLAIEYHIPFQPVNSSGPTEIVFDLDPPSVEAFHLTLEAAKQMKVIFDGLGFLSFIKTSGGKGMQIYIPLPANSFTYEDTGLFTKFICDFLIEQAPSLYTIERLKKNRRKKLYLDYVQHREGKTIIAPYSPRGNESGFIATPLEWEEVKPGLTPDQFTIPVMIERVRAKGDLFRHFRKNVNNNEEALTRFLRELKGE